MKEFRKVAHRKISEIKGRAEIYIHENTGSRVLSISNDDENKVFGITFRTPPNDSSGVAHILEHSVLCGSRKYPVKEPFVELLKGSLKTFLNAMTYPDRTCYPVASQNETDFYNLVDVYLDAVFHPKLEPHVFKQEGWHLHMETPDAPLSAGGVVYNEMKGAHSSPDNLLIEFSKQSLFPDTPYRFESGGEPEAILSLTYERFLKFHRDYYHPSNAWIYFYGDDDVERRLKIIHDYLKEFKRSDIQVEIPLQSEIKKEKRLEKRYPSSETEAGNKRSMFTVNWLLPLTRDLELNMAFQLLEYILLGMPGSPLRKALMDSGLGEDIAGEGLSNELIQMYFSTGLKGIRPDDGEKVEHIIFNTLNELSQKGIDPLDIEASFNTLEFALRENNTGSLPRGLVIMLRVLSVWIYGGDPFRILAFEEPLDKLKKDAKKNKRYFEELIERFFLNNPNRTTLLLSPDTKLSSIKGQKEKEILNEKLKDLGQDSIQKIVNDTRELIARQAMPDTPEALATIPTLKLSEIERRSPKIPCEIVEVEEAKTLIHDIHTNRIIYLDIGFNMHSLSPDKLPFAKILGRALLEAGTKKEDYIRLSQRISRKTGGIRPSILFSSHMETQKPVLWLFWRGKVIEGNQEELLGILEDVFLIPNLENIERIRQIVLEEKARMEQTLIPRGHEFLSLRIESHLRESHWAGEMIGGISYLFFLRVLLKTIEDEPEKIIEKLKNVRDMLIKKGNILINVTLEGKSWDSFSSLLDGFLSALPEGTADDVDWGIKEDIQRNEALLIPAHVNYVGKGMNLYDNGYRFHGSSKVILRYIRNTYFWEKIRVQGGAYGAFCIFDHLSGNLSMISYRDPAVMDTVKVFDSTYQFLKEIDITEDELRKSIIGTIGDIDRPRLPDAKGFTSMIWYLSGETDEQRQRTRDEVLGTSKEDFRVFSEAITPLSHKGILKVLGSQNSLSALIEEGILKSTSVL